MIIESVTGEYRATPQLSYRFYLWKDQNGAQVKIIEEPGIRFLSTSITEGSLGNRYFHRKFRITIPFRMIMQLIISANGRPTHNYKIPILVDETEQKMSIQLKAYNKFGIEFRGKILGTDKKLLKEFFSVQISDMSTIEKADEHGILC